jgi:transposase
MPGYHIKFASDTSSKMQKLLKTENNASNIKRIQCIYFRSRFDYPAQQIADMVGFSVQTVRDVHSSFIKHGENALFVKNKGGRMIENMSLKDEKAFLANLEQEGSLGQILEINTIHQKLMTKLGRAIPKSSAYNLLHRHGWRKIAPRPYHPKSNPEAQEAFKKTLPKWSKMQMI